jgi:hypothetical protein
MLYSDHLGSITTTESSTGAVLQQGYKPWGEVRPGPNNTLPTDYTYTG